MVTSHSLSGSARVETRENPVERVLLDFANRQMKPGGVVRDLTRLLKTREFDWRDLGRALERIAAGATGPTGSGQPADLQTISTAARIALLATHRAMGAPPEPRDMSAEIRLQQAASLEDGPEEMLRRVFEVLREIVDFDIATYVEYESGSDDAAAPLVRGRFATDGPDVFTWPARWIEVDPRLVEWMKGNDRLIPDLNRFYKTKVGAQALRKNPVSLEYKRRGAHSVVSVPRIDGGRLLGAISLARRKTKLTFNADDQERLDQLGLDRVMRLASEGFLAYRRRLAASIAALFDTETSPAAIARTFVDGIGRGFGWEYVAIFRVAHTRERFEIVSQYDATGGKLSLNPGYSQPLEDAESGMIGEARRAGTALRARNVRPPRRKPQNWQSPYNYIRNNKAQASAMCVPIKLGRDVEWVLDCESTQVDGFMQPDEDAIVALVADVERTIRLWFESRLNKALLNRVDQGVIVVNEHHRIERLNSAASKLLGCDTAIGLPLAGFARDEAAQKLLGSQTHLPASGVQIALQGADGRDRFVLASAREPEDTFHRRIWLFSDLADSQWIADLSHVRQTVQDVAAQTRGPLLLANALVRQARHLVSSGGASRLAHDVLERATRSLNKTDITYERLASSLEAISEPHRETRLAPFSVVSALTILSHSLPAEDEAALKLNVPANLPAIRADSERMAFALRSIIGYLLSVRAPDAKVALQAWAAHGGGVSLRASLEANTALLSEPTLTQSNSTDHAEHVGQVLTAARTIVESHGGRLECRTTVDGLEVYVEELPTSTAPGASAS